MKHTSCLIAVIALTFSVPSLVISADLSEATETCIECHEIVTPGIVGDWKKSRHADTSPSMALQKDRLARRISAESLPENLVRKVVGCAECHTLNEAKHSDTFEHNGFNIHTVVSPPDCGVCHPVETSEYAENLMSQAYGNLMDNPVYKILVDNVNGSHQFNGEGIILHDSTKASNADSCLSCHGTVVKITGSQSRETELGEMEFPVFSNWPNAGVGRVNPDGSVGACSSCHMRHQFSIEVARKPYTCAQCHKGPDVPAYKVYSVSVHGNIQKSVDKSWNYSAVPWTVGKDFTAPTCATCHASLIIDSNGEVIAQRSHRMNDRLPWRIFGLPYAHPHPQSADTSLIVNKAGLNLPTELSGEPVSKYLIGRDEMEKRQAAMQSVCSGCHSKNWVNGHFTRLDNAIATSNDMTLQATKVLSRAWKESLAEGLPQNKNPFDEVIEQKWVEQWLFYGNSVRFASAMGGADYGVFADGRWTQQKNLQGMFDYYKFLKAEKNIRLQQ